MRFLHEEGGPDMKIFKTGGNEGRLPGHNISDTVHSAPLLLLHHTRELNIFN